VFAFCNRGKLFEMGIVEEKDDPDGKVNRDAYSMGEFFSEGICSPR